MRIQRLRRGFRTAIDKSYQQIIQSGESTIETLLNTVSSMPTESICQCTDQLWRKYVVVDENWQIGRSSKAITHLTSIMFEIVYGNAGFETENFLKKVVF